MNVNSATAIGRVVLPTAANQPPAGNTAMQIGGGAASVRVDAVTKQPLPPRYPWLSRLARELEPVSKQPLPYGSVPPLGEKVDQQA